MTAQAPIGVGWQSLALHGTEAVHGRMVGHRFRAAGSARQCHTCPTGS